MKQFIVLVVFVFFVAKVSGQSVINSTYCVKAGIHCPRDHDASYQTKCCVTLNGYSPIYTCCNPYVAMYISIGVIVPLLVCMVAVPLIICCIWKKKTQRKMRRLAAEVTAGTRRTGNDEIDAPPSYSMSGDGNQLPAYTEEDPYKAATVEASLAIPAEEDDTPKDNNSEDSVNSSDNQPLLND